jgi:hypothetical protein
MAPDPRTFYCNTREAKVNGMNEGMVRVMDDEVRHDEDSDMDAVIRGAD